jgi:hypothetical protein
MKRLDFTLPDFTRLIWVNERALNVWEPRINQIARVWWEIEWLSVALGIRSCCLIPVRPEELVSQTEKWIEHNFEAVPLQLQQFPLFSYANTSGLAKLGKPVDSWMIVGTFKKVSDLQQAFEANDTQQIGRLLGIPSCCIKFFQKTRIAQNLLDTTWSMAANSTTSSDEDRSLTVIGPPEANILWQSLNIRAVPHLPCSFECKESVELGKKLIKIGREAGYEAEMDWLLDILSWPVEWSALHGIAEIKTPILKISTRTDATPIKYVIRREGEAVPLEGAKGLNFPYHIIRKPFVTKSSESQRGLDNPITLENPSPAKFAFNNGFTSI